MAIIGSLTSGISALKTFSKGLEVIGNNIANVNTTGCKSSSTSFADTFNNTVRGGSTPVQVGTGVQISGISTTFTQGSLSSTGKASDLSVAGNGYFVVQDANGANYATRDGNFTWQENGNLVNTQGFKVLDDAGVAINVATVATAASITVGDDGSVTAFATNGTSTSTQKVGLLRITDENRLLRRGGNLFDFANTGAVVGDIGTAAADGLGMIRSGALELSNVDLTEQFSELITTQRSFQAGSRLITVSDSVLEDIVNLKR